MEDVKLRNTFLQACKEGLHKTPDGGIARPISVMLASNDMRLVGYAEGWMQDATEHSGIPIGPANTKKTSSQ